MRTRSAAGSLVGLAAVAMLWTTPAAAQDSGDGSFRDVPLKLRIGDTVLVTDAAGREQKGKVLDLSAESLSLLVKGTRRNLFADEIRSVDLEHADSLKNGALTGFAIGAGGSIFAVMAVGAESVTAPELVAAAFGGLLIYGGIGAALGTLVDALIEERLPIYRITGRPSTPKVTIGPIVARDKKGVAIAVRFAP